MGIVYQFQGKWKESATACRKSVQIDDQYAKVWYNLGVANYRQKLLDRAVAAYRKAIDVDSEYYLAWYNLGVTYRDLNKLTDAEASLKKALLIEPRNAKGWNELGVVLVDQKKLNEALVAYKTSVKADRRHTNAQINMGMVLQRLGRFAESEAALTQVLQLLRPQHPHRSIVLNFRRQNRELMALEKKLPSALKGEVASSADLLNLAILCQRYLRRYRDGVKLYAEAFAVDPKLAGDVKKPHRYNAVCIAALAAAGKGKDTEKIPDEDCARLRRKAHEWLQADLIAWENLFKQTPLTAVLLHEKLSHWQNDPDLTTIREDKELKKLPNDVQQSWRKLWSRAEQTRKTARAAYLETILKGTLTGQQTQTTHTVDMAAGRVYLILMQSKLFDTFLRIEDPQGKKLAENDDIDTKRRILNSRIQFRPKRDAKFHVIATSYMQSGRGSYEIIVREFRAKE